MSDGIGQFGNPQGAIGADLGCALLLFQAACFALCVASSSRLSSAPAQTRLGPALWGVLGFSLDFSWIAARRLLAQRCRRDCEGLESTAPTGV